MIATQGRSFMKLSKLGLIAVRVAISLVLQPTVGHALGTENERAACTPDVFRLCSSEIPDISRVTACMIKNHANLSSGCRSVMDRDQAAQSRQVASK